MTDATKSRYQARLLNAFRERDKTEDREERDRLSGVIYTYEHLLVCNKIHKPDQDGEQYCKWDGGTV